jgi:hypothetical protein
MDGTVFIPPFTFMVYTTKSLISPSNHGILGLVCEVFLINFKFLTNFGHKVDIFLVLLEGVLMGLGNWWWRGYMQKALCLKLPKPSVVRP